MKSWIDQKFNPGIEGCQAVSEILTSKASRDQSNRRDFKDYVGGQIFFEHAGSAPRLKLKSIKNLIVDELDDFSSELSSGDDPESMLRGRTTTFSNRKILFIGTPQISGVSRLEELYEKSDQRRYFFKCPFCNFEQTPVWSGIVWNKFNPKDVHYECCECGGQIKEHYKTEMIAKGRWIPQRPEVKDLRGYHANGILYPVGLGFTWVELVERWLDINGDVAKLKTFINDILAEPFVDKTMQKVRIETISNRAETYRLSVAPLGVGIITAAIDCQDNRLAIQKIGFGEDLVAWVLDYIEVMGDPNEPEVWDKATEIINAPIEREDGKLLYVSATAIDTGGHRTNAAYNYVRQKRIKRPMAIRGAQQINKGWLSKGKLVDVNFRGQTDKFGVMLYEVGTIYIKDEIYQRIAADSEKDVEDRKFHFSDELDEDYFKGIVSEVKDLKTGRYIKKRGIKRNEPLDTAVYAFAATHHHELRCHRYSKAKWATLVGKEKSNSAPIGAKQIPAPVTTPPKKSSFIMD